MFLIYVITFADAYHEVWLYPEDADLDATAHEVQGLIDRRNAIPGAPQIVKTQRVVGMVYRKPGRFGSAEQASATVV